MMMKMNTVCNSNLLFIKYIYYTVQVEFCYNVAHMCRASSSLVECVLYVVQVPSRVVCSLECVIQVKKYGNIMALYTIVY